MFAYLPPRHRTRMPSLFPILTAGLATGLLIYLLAPLARRIGLVDSPGRHKSHEGQVPLVGGIAMFCGFLFAVLTAQVSLGDLRPLFAGAALLVIVGIFDDFNELGTNSRFAAQIVAGLFMVIWGGVGLESLGRLVGPDVVHTGFWVVPFTVFSVVGVVNAVNMLDGLDGLAGGLSLVVSTVLAFAALSAGDTSSALMLMILAATIMAFLAFNLRVPGRPRALVFMGDAGSMFLGFVLAWHLVALSQPGADGSAAAIAPVTALWILALPLMDTVGIMLRRVLAGRSPFAADREHLHHLLGRLGLGVSCTMLLVVALTAGLAAIGLAAQQGGVPEHQMFAAFLSLFAVYFLCMELAWRRFNRMRPVSG